MLRARLGNMKRRREVEDGPPVLDGRDSPCGEAGSSAQAIHEVHDGRIQVAGQDEVSMRRGCPAVGGHGAAGGTGARLPTDSGA